jgi:crotonobetainyl-CoA:carnitine CoA-transferase CaiB-like acyl-CoA transferase
MSGLQTGVRQVAPLAPADTDDVLAEIGYLPAEIATMRTEGVT